MERGKIGRGIRPCLSNADLGQLEYTLYKKIFYHGVVVVVVVVVVCVCVCVCVLAVVCVCV